MTEPIKIGLMGLGTVGGGTVSALTENQALIRQKTGHDIVIARAAAKIYDSSKIKGLDNVSTIGNDVYEIVNDPEIDIVVELIGGYNPAKELILAAIKNKKHVVTANKALIATHGNEIFEEADKQGVMVAFEAAVAGGIPIIKALREGLVANRIHSIVGIINGTCNYILTEMRERGSGFNAALESAQSLGYAEADPSFDIEGMDTAHKLTILSALAFGIPLQLNKVYTQGIREIEKKDVIYAGELGYRIKHLGITRRVNNNIELRVHPALVPEQDIIANVDGVMNAVTVAANATGNTLYYGAGAGAAPTASAVLADVIEVARCRHDSSLRRMLDVFFYPHESELNILEIEEVETAYYLRMQVVDQPGMLAKITKIMGDMGISIEAILQKEPKSEARDVPVVFLTRKVLEKKMKTALAEIQSLENVSNDIVSIRIEESA